jgi:hypothetical protein
MSWGAEKIVIMGWLVAVLVEIEGVIERRFFAVAQPDQGKAEWSAVDCAILEGPVATSPANGHEPVEAIRALTASAVRAAGLAPGTVKPLGPRLPRRWLSLA